MKLILTNTLLMTFAFLWLSTATADTVDQEIAKIESFLATNGPNPELELHLKQLKSQKPQTPAKAVVPAARKKPKSTKKTTSKSNKKQSPTKEDKYSIMKKNIEKAEARKKELQAKIQQPAALELQRLPANKTAPDVREPSEFRIGVMADMYYLYNLNNPVGGQAVSARNYDQLHNDLTMNLLEINFQGTFDKVGYYVDLDFGNFADQNAGHQGDGVGHNLGQAYLTYDWDGYLFSAGKMYTNVGYEVAKSQDNWNYSRSFAFSLGGPFWHEGFSVTKSYESGFGWGFFVYDDWDSRVETNSNKTYSGQLKYSNDSFSFIYNYISGRQNPPGSTNGSGFSLDTSSKSVHEFNTQWDLNSNFSFALNGVFGTDSDQSGTMTEPMDNQWQAWVAYVRWQQDKWALTGRYEIFSYENGLPDAEDGSALTGDKFDWNSVTITGSYQLSDQSELRVEARNDVASQNFYLSDGELGTDQTTLSLSWLFRM